MTIAAFTQMKQLRDSLTAEPLGITAELTTFPSGGAMLDVRRDGRAFVMAYAPLHGYGIDQLQPDDGFVTGYRFVFDNFEPASRQLKALATGEPSVESPTLSLVVLRSADIESAKDFYTRLGLSFCPEQHGQGPRHYSAKLGRLVLEIYPCQESNMPSPVRIGFHVARLDETLESLRANGTRIIQPAQDSPWGRRAVVEDPDGNRVELASASPTPTSST
jgi:lactoylglutathione lyase